MPYSNTEVPTRRTLGAMVPWQTWLILAFLVTFPVGWVLFIQWIKRKQDRE